MRRPDKKLLRLVAFATLSITLIVAGAIWAVRSSGVSADDVRALAGLPATTLLLLAALAAALYGTDIVRYRVLGQAVGAPMSRRTALEASIVCFFFGWTTPGTAFVAPTPGGAGLAEAMATVFYGSLLPPGRAVVVVLLFRGLTFYLHIAVGLLYLPLAGVWRQIAGASREMG